MTDKINRLAEDVSKRSPVGQPPAGVNPFLLLIALMVCFCVINIGFWLNWSAPVFIGLFKQEISPAFANRDFANYWLAGRLVLSGEWLDLFRQSTHQLQLESAIGISPMEIRAWSYPPHFLLLLWPLGWMDYPLAYLLFMVISFSIFLAALKKLVDEIHDESQPSLILLPAMVLIAPYIILQIAAGQNGFLFSAILLFALLYRQSHPVWCGIMLAILTMKPQLGVLFPFLLLIEKNYAAIFWASVFSIALMVTSMALFSLESWQLFFSETLPYQQYVAREWVGVFLEMMPTWFAAARFAGYEVSVATHLAILNAVVVFGLFVFTLRYAQRAMEDFWRILLFLTATFALSPYAFHYDIGAMILAFAVWRSAHTQYINNQKGFGLFGNLGLALLFAFPLLMPLRFITFDTVSRLHNLLIFLPTLVVSGLFIACSLQFWIANRSNKS